MSIGTIGTVVGAGATIAGAAGGKGDDEGVAGQAGYGVYDVLGADRKVYLNKLARLMARPNSIRKSGAYKSRVRQGLRAVESSAAGRGLLDSGQMGVELMQAGQDMASEEYDKEFQKLSLLAGAQFAPQVFGSGQDPTLQDRNLSAAFGGLTQGAQGIYDLWNRPQENRQTYSGGSTPTEDRFGPRDAWS